MTGKYWCCRIAWYYKKIKQDIIAKKMDNFEKLNVDVNYKSDDSNNYSLVAYCKFGRAITHLGKTPTQKMQEHYNASKLNVRF